MEGSPPGRNLPPRGFTGRSQGFPLEVTGSANEPDTASRFSPRKGDRSLGSSSSEDFTAYVEQSVREQREWRQTARVFDSQQQAELVCADVLGRYADEHPQADYDERRRVLLEAGFWYPPDTGHFNLDDWTLCPCVMALVRNPDQGKAILAKLRYR